LNYNDRIAGNINDISQESNELKESMDRASGGLHKLTDSVEAVNSKLGDFTVLGRSLGFLVVLKNAEHPVDLAFDCLGRFEAMAAKGSPVAGRTPPEPSLAIDFAQDQVLISQTDPRGVISYANNDFCEVSGYLFEELVGKPHNIIRHPFMPRGAFGNMWATLKAGEVWQGIVVNKTKDEGHYWVKATVYPNFDNGTVVGYTSLRTKPTPEQVRRAIAAYQYIP
jgi:PAS domain S-box-containing protein